MEPTPGGLLAAHRRRSQSSKRRAESRVIPWQARRTRELGRRNCRQQDLTGAPPAPWQNGPGPMCGMAPAGFVVRLHQVRRCSGEFGTGPARAVNQLLRDGGFDDGPQQTDAELATDPRGGSHEVFRLPLPLPSKIVDQRRATGVP